MKIVRSSKIYFIKWLTRKKSKSISNFLLEYSNIVNYFITKYHKLIPENSKLSFLYAVKIQECIEKTQTWLSARAVKNAFAEGYGMVLSARSQKKYFKPVHYGKRAVLSCTVNTQSTEVTTKEFDFNVTLGSIGNKQKISIPLKRHKQFNKWDKAGKRSSSIILTNKYVMFSFEVLVDKKKETGELLGIDVGINKLLSFSNGTHLGLDYKELLYKLNRKKKYSKSWYRTKEEIREYIDVIVKKIPVQELKLIVVETLKNLKYKMKLKHRLSKNVRCVISVWSYRQILSRIQKHCEENRVTFRSVPAYYTSVDCPKCNHRDKRNRISQEDFRCQSCGYSGNADLVAAKNILIRFLTGTYGSCYKPRNLLAYLSI